jgi:hypothetical protein
VLAVAAGKQPLSGPRDAPIRAQDPEQLRRQHGVAVAASFALLDADDHAAAVDIGDLEACRFGRAQPGRIGRGQRGTRLQARYRFQETHDFIRTQHHRQLLRLTSMRDPLRQVRLLERYAVQEAKGADGLVQRRP